MGAGAHYSAALTPHVGLSVGARANMAVDSPAADLAGAQEMAMHLQKTFSNIRNNIEGSVEHVMHKMQDTATRIEDVEKSLAEISALTHFDALPDLAPLSLP